MRKFKFNKKFLRVNKKKNMKTEDLKYIDCHSHPHDKKFLETGVDVENMMQELLEDGGATIAIGTDYLEMEKAINFAKKFENCWATIGIHPADNHSEIFDGEKFEKFLEFGRGKIVGIGECGLDYFYFKTDFEKKVKNENLEKTFEDYCKEQKERQKTLFISQVDFAAKHKLPLVIHGRPSKNSMDAYEDVLDILEEKARKSKAFSGHAHFFVGNLEIAKRFLKLGFLLSFDGPITFTEEYDKVIDFTPMEKIMIETDAPYAAPTPFRGHLNYSKYVKFVAQKIAKVKNLSEKEVLEITKNNTINLFGLNKK